MSKEYYCKLKSRKQLENDIPRDRWGWWIDVCPGSKLMLRPATSKDLKRCCIARGWSKNPEDYLCETSQHGALVSKEAIEHVMMPVSIISQLEGSQ